MVESQTTSNAKRFFLFILIFLICTDLSIFLDIPVLRQILVPAFLTIVPGLLILHILKLNKSGLTERIFFSVGLSVALLMLVGLLSNTLCPLIGILKPLSILPLVIAINISLLVLGVLGYKINKDFLNPISVNIRDLLSPPMLFLCLIPLLAIFATYLVNFYHNNILIMILIVMIALVALLIGFDKFIPKNLYPLAVFVITLSLLFHRSLISMYVGGWDIQFEYHLCNAVEMNSIWDPTIPGNLNGMLSLVMLAPIYSIISNIDITWVFKIIYPVLFSLVPLGLYCVFRKQTDDRIAFLSCFFFMSVAASFSEMPALARQEIAELFLVLMVFLMIDKDMNKMKGAFLLIVFSASLVVSHYGLTYIYMLCLIPAWLTLVLYDKFGRYKNGGFTSDQIASNKNDRTINWNFVALFVVLALGWYMSVSSASAFVTIVQIGNHIISSIRTSFLDPTAAEGIYMMMGVAHYTPLGYISRIINYLNQIFIVIGVIALLLRFREMKFQESILFSTVALVLLFAGVSVPFFASSLNMERLYQITLIFLAPFCIIGGITTFRLMSKAIRVIWTDKHVRRSLAVLSVYLVIFFLYQTGFIIQVAEGHSHFPLDKAKDSLYFNEQEVLGADWLDVVKDDRNPIYADEPRWLLLSGRLEKEGQLSTQLHVFTTDTSQVPEECYIYFGTRNIVKQEVTLTDRRATTVIREFTTPESIVDGRSKIYANGGSEVYK